MIKCFIHFRDATHIERNLFLFFIFEIYDVKTCQSLNGTVTTQNPCDLRVVNDNDQMLKDNTA